VIVYLLVAAGVAIAGAVWIAVLLRRPKLATAAALRDAAEHVGESDFVPVGGPVAPALTELAAELTTAHRRLIEAQDRERRVEQGRHELVTWVSHDLRTPLAGLRAMAEALEDGIVDEPADVARYHARMRLDVDKLAGMVDDMFELAQVRTGAISLSLTRVSVTDLVSDAVASADPLARAKGVRLRRGCADRPGGRAGPDASRVGAGGADGWGESSAGVEVEVDVAEVGRVLSNLLVNAIRHTPAAGTVAVATGGGDGSAWISVQDACGGIPADDLDRIFEVGYRGKAARTPGTEPGGAGAGLGLAIARGIVAAHGGAIAVDNTDSGCCFVVTFPAAV
jgi:signal transduction histidine kinase